MSKKCKSCGQDGYGESYPALIPEVTGEGFECSVCTKKARKKKRYCNVIPAGIETCPRGCLCQSCRNVRRTRVVYADDSCITKGGTDEIGLEAFQAQTKLPQHPSQCRPFTKDAYAEIDITFGFPRVGDSAMTQITNVRLAEGQPITHPEYGTLIAHPRLCEENQYELENPGTNNNGLDAIGKPVVCGKRFFLGWGQFEFDENPETLECNSLLEDFTVPALNTTAEATVLSYLGFAINDQVVIRNKVDPNTVYTYRVSGSTGENTLILENEGDGGTIGGVLSAASDVEGEYAWCVESLEDQSTCALASETLCLQHILGCDENGNPRKLTGDIENEAPVYDPECGGFALKVISKPVVCVLLDACFQIAHVEEICNRVPITITTLDDQKLLDEATAALLSVNADPLINICGYEFSLNLATSSVGTLNITPNFNPPEIVNFDRNCKVCIPEDCCFQCNPQVNYPVDSYNPPGLNKSLNVRIPASIITGFGEYKMSVVKQTDTGADLLLVHDNGTNEVTAVYDTNGNPVSIGSLPADPNNYSYNTIDYCNDDACPVDVNYEEDINARFYGLVLGEQISFNYHTDFGVYNCFELGSLGQELTGTQYGIMGHFVGPSKTSGIAFGTERFGQVVPDVINGGFKTYDAISNHKKRTFVLFYPTCTRIRTLVTILLLIEEKWEAISENWAYASATTITINPGGGARYAASQEIRFTQSGGTVTGVISAVADTLLSITGATVLDEPIFDRFRRYIRGEKLLQMETTSMLRTQVI